MATGTTANCTQVSQFNSNVVVYNQRGLKGTAILNKVTNSDLKVTDDVYLTGGKLLVKSAYFGDFCDMQVVDVDGILYPAGSVLRQFVTAYYLDDTEANQGEFDLTYPAVIRAGLYMRLVYHSTGGMVTPQPAVNFAFHTILVPPTS